MYCVLHLWATVRIHYIVNTYLHFKTSKAIFGSKLEFRVSYKGGSKVDPLLDPLKKGVTNWNPLNES